jgi:hypothetical protein
MRRAIGGGSNREEDAVGAFLLALGGLDLAARSLELEAARGILAADLALEAVALAVGGERFLEAARRGQRIGEREPRLRFLRLVAHLRGEGGGRREPLHGDRVVASGQGCAAGIELVQHQQGPV